MSTARIRMIIALCSIYTVLAATAVACKNPTQRTHASFGSAELTVEDQSERLDLATLDSWVAQLNDAAAGAAASSDREERLAKGKLCQSLVYGIEKQLNKFNLYQLTDADKRRIANNMARLNPFAQAYYQRDKERWCPHISLDLPNSRLKPERRNKEVDHAAANN